LSKTSHELYSVQQCWQSNIVWQYYSQIMVIRAIKTMSHMSFLQLWKDITVFCRASGFVHVVCSIVALHVIMLCLKLTDVLRSALFKYVMLLNVLF